MNGIGVCISENAFMVQVDEMLDHCNRNPLILRADILVTQETNASATIKST